jgi:hypothetical protein
MSRTYSIGCKDCKKHIWVAQKGSKSPTFYSGMPEVMQRLTEFLFTHIGHNLVFDENTETEMVDWEEVET